MVGCFLSISLVGVLVFVIVCMLMFFVCSFWIICVLRELLLMCFS